MPDWWELGYFGNTNQVANGDVDNDGLTNLAEYNAGTVPNVADTDGDGMKDGFEAGTSGYQVVLGSFHWDTARLHAIAKGGNLATITSAAEKTTIASQVTQAEMNELWLGGYKSGASWAWVTGETWDESVYNNWMPNEPGAIDGQNYLRLKTFNEGWDNWFATPTFSTLPVAIRGYLLEKSQTTDPTKFNHPLITVAGDFQEWKAEPTPAAAPANVMNPGTGTNQFVRTLDYRFPVAARFTGKFANGEVFTSSNNINWGTSANAGLAQRNGFGNDIPFNVTSTGWWTFTFNTDTLSYGFARKAFSAYLEYAAAYNLPADGSGGGETEDNDGDGLTNAQEFSANTNPASGDSDEDTVPDAYEVNTSTTNPLLADTDSDTLPDWWELNVGLDPNSSAGDNGPLGNPDGDLFTNKQEFDGQSDPKSAASVPANRAVTFTLNLNRQISSGAFLTNSHTAEVWGTFNDWGNLTNSKFTLTNNGSGIYTGTHTLPGAEGSTNRYKYVTFPSSNNAVWEDGNDRSLVMGADGVATNLPTAYLGEVRPVTFSVNMGVQATLGRFTHGTHKVYVAGDVVGSWNPPGTELARVGSSDVYSAVVFVSGTNNATANYKFYANNALGFEADLDAGTTGDQTRVLTLGARDTAQTNAEVYFNNVTNVPANRTVTFAVNMGVQRELGIFNPDSDKVYLVGDPTGDGSFATGVEMLREGSTDVFKLTQPVVGAAGAVLNYKFRSGATGAANNGYEGDVNPAADKDTRVLALGAVDSPQVLDPVFFNNEEQVRSLTFKVDMGVQITKGLFAHGDPIQVRFGDFNATNRSLTREGSTTIYSGTYAVAGNAGSTFEYKFWRTNGATNVTFERVDAPRTNELLNRSHTLGSNGVAVTLSPTPFFSNDDGIGPVITLAGANPLNLTNGATWTDPGATAVDVAEGTSTSITGVGSVNTAVAGSYTVTYNASDAAGNAATAVTRTVVVAAADPLADYMTSFGLSGADAAGDADPDGDGQNNNAELAFGTDPTNGSSRAATLASGTGTIKLVYLQRNSGITYTVKSFTDVAQSANANFDGNGTPVTPTPTDPQPAGVRSGYTQYEASVSTSGTRAFLRVKAVR